jgi:hypothetical protein
MLGWWTEQPPYLRTTIALIPCALAAGCWFIGAWRAGIVVGSFGVVLLALSFPSRAEQKGFHDF